MNKQEFVLSDAEFVKKEIIKIFGKMPENISDIIISDIYGKEARYKGLIIRFETSEERIHRWEKENDVY